MSVNNVLLNLLIYGMMMYSLGILNINIVQVLFSFLHKMQLLNLFVGYVFTETLPDTNSSCVQTQRLQKELRAEHDLAQKGLRAERDLTQRELQEGSRRLQQECDHRVALERDKIRQMEEERMRLMQQVQCRER